ncbi:FAD-binding oxidoreductase [Rhizobiaceae bacterium n13]|uniref:FAD-binding oxidoreductase n=1 Tax=Ferirhizobium litorale TaxID=2927786 RepID=A0AAE3QA12_9HYPH|nr:FAD-binding oxidoreductase [Fererhizobium litorale]MDI7861711.1 FAD-binding oxidoreductase [Fererhizobium litorale]MDI7921947.1 FAD-binding oxidoreductase [Fererhizobium litorale]
MREFDIAIIGGGIAGLSLAYFLGGSRSVVVLEREQGLGYHSTGRSAAEFLLGYMPLEVTRMAAVAKEFFDAPPAGFAVVPLLQRRGSLIIANAEKAENVRKAFETETARGGSPAMLTAEEAIDRAPILDPDYVAHAFYDPDFWDIEVDTLLQGYARGARHAGVEVRERAEVLSARYDGRRWVIVTTDGEIAARQVVNAAGAWADSIADIFGVEPQGIVPHRRTAILVDLPEGIDAAALPEVNEVDEEFYFKPDGGRLLVSPADETPSVPTDAQPEEIDVAWAAHYVEEATTVEVRRVARSWAGLRSFSPDRLPVIGPAPDQPHFFWLAGQGGFGILSSPALGQLAASILLEKEPPEACLRHGLDRQHFRPGRF